MSIESSLPSASLGYLSYSSSFRKLICIKDGCREVILISFLESHMRKHIGDIDTAEEYKLREFIEKYKPLIDDVFSLKAATTTIKLVDSLDILSGLKY